MGLFARQPKRKPKPEGWDEALAEAQDLAVEASLKLVRECFDQVLRENPGVRSVELTDGYTHTSVTLGVEY